MFKHINYIMVNVSDMAKSVAFYRDQIGLPLKYETPYWSEFETGKTILALHHAQKPAHGAQAKTDGAIAGTCSIGFSMDDIEQAYSDLKAKGVKFIMPPKTQESEGIKLTVCIDPDGMQISIAEALKQS